MGRTGAGAAGGEARCRGDFLPTFPRDLPVSPKLRSRELVDLVWGRNPSRLAPPPPRGFIAGSMSFVPLAPISSTRLLMRPQAADEASAFRSDAFRLRQQLAEVVWQAERSVNVFRYDACAPLIGCYKLSSCCFVP